MNLLLLVCADAIVVNLNSRRFFFSSRVQNWDHAERERNVLLGRSKGPSSDCQQCF